MNETLLPHCKHFNSLMAMQVLDHLRVLFWVSLMRERDRKIHFLKSVLSTLTQVAEFTSCFLEVCTHHHATSLCQWPLFQSHLIAIFFHLSFPHHI